MNPITYRTLEFETIRQWVLSHVGSAAGRSRLQTLGPRTTTGEVRAALHLTSEARQTLESFGRQPYHDLPDVEPLLPKTRWKGFALEPRELLDVASFAAGVTEIGRQLRDGAAPEIAARAQKVADFTSLSSAITRAVLPSGELADDASPRLSELRRGLLRQRAQLQSLMESFLHGKESERLQEKLVTTRNDRYVLVLKAEQRSAVPGIIHGRSGSGASLFVEPLPAVEMNNEIVSLQDEERTEIARILEELTSAAGARYDDLARALSVSGELDALQALASASRDVDGVEPEIASDLRLDLRQARHPLLLSAVTDRVGAPRRSRREAVPVDIALDPRAPVLVISGPNTGGKTVALKTVGLFALMAQSGLHVPAAAGSTLPVFQRIYADIGDEQSISGDLSTFSAHLATIQEMTRDLAAPALVLLDEVGAGTDPTEGGALGVAIVDYFRRQKAMVLATTHHGLMKAYSLSTPGVTSASFGYHPETYQPTYQLRQGEPGRSLALEMTERLGFPNEIVADARARLSQKEAQVEALARRLESDREELAHRETALRAREESLTAAVREQEEAAREQEARRQREAQAFAAELRRRSELLARQAADAVREAVQRVEGTRRAAVAEGTRARARAIETIREARDEALQAVGIALPAAAPKVAREVTAGDRVRLNDLGGVIGEVVGVHGELLEIAVSGKRLRAPQSAVVLVEGAKPMGGRTSVMVSRTATETAAAEINIVGLRVDEALPRVDKALDDAALGESREVRVIHGFGQGKLRRAVADLLSGHPHVASFRTGGPGEGGGGVTIAELKD